MPVRPPVVAGRFYPSQPDTCRNELVENLPRELPAISGTAIGGVGPHAGWMCSGAVAASVAAALGRDRAPLTAVMFGAVHVGHGQRASLYGSGAWETPLGRVEIDGDLAERIATSSPLVEPNAAAHQFEHSIEVHVPFLQHVLPRARIVPIMVPANERAHRVGEAVGRVCRD